MNNKIKDRTKKNMPNITKIIVYSEKTLADLERAFPKLYSVTEKLAVAITGVAAAGAMSYHVKGDPEELKKAKEHLENNSKIHDVKY